MIEWVYRRIGRVIGHGFFFRFDTALGWEIRCVAWQLFRIESLRNQWEQRDRVTLHLALRTNWWYHQQGRVKRWRWKMKDEDEDGDSRYETDMICLICLHKLPDALDQWIEKWSCQFSVCRRQCCTLYAVRCMLYALRCAPHLALYSLCSGRSGLYALGREGAENFCSLCSVLGGTRRVMFRPCCCCCCRWWWWPSLFTFIEDVDCTSRSKSCPSHVQVMSCHVMSYHVKLSVWCGHSHSHPHPIPTLTCFEEKSNCSPTKTFAKRERRGGREVAGMRQ